MMCDQELTSKVISCKTICHIILRSNQTINTTDTFNVFTTATATQTTLVTKFPTEPAIHTFTSPSSFQMLMHHHIWMCTNLVIEVWSVDILHVCLVYMNSYRLMNTAYTITVEPILAHKMLKF